MKKNLIFLLFFIFPSCTTIEKQQTIAEICPDVFFSKEHKIYLTGNESPLKIENISYKAELNNYFFNNECSVLNNVLNSNLSLLFVIKPENLNQDVVLLPYYIMTLNPEDKILDIQYYSIEGVIRKDPETSIYLETELVDTVDIQILYKDLKTNLKNSIVIGFMLNQEKINLLN